MHPRWVCRRWRPHSYPNENNLYRIIGRDSDVINVGGLKFMSSDVEKVVLEYSSVLFAKIVVKKKKYLMQRTENLQLKGRQKYLKIIKNSEKFL